ncbi:MAG: biotin--[Bacteroidales bacterium]|nr:biotin--[acetyl-CoA-carboxylase] ligase [Bacteroidales bacterium]
MKNTRIQFNANTQSTNKLLSETVEKGMLNGKPVPPFFALCTDFQSDGRGMGTNTWYSDRGKNLLASFYFEPDIPAARQFLFNQYFALSTLAFIRRYLPQALIKWPNDIYVDGKKIAGILIEHVLRGDKLQHTIAGIGININQEHFPENIPHPTSFLLETGKEWEPESLLEEYWQMLYDQRNLCDISQSNYLNEQYLNNLYLFNTFHHYRIHGAPTEAKITGLDVYGRLMLHTRTGERLVCGFKEIRFL